MGAPPAGCEGMGAPFPASHLPQLLGRVPKFPTPEPQTLLVEGKLAEENPLTLAPSYFHFLVLDSVRLGQKHSLSVWL